MNLPNMTLQRYRELQKEVNTGTDLSMTIQEAKEWCFCIEWDLMLIHKDWVEVECCHFECFTEDGLTKRGFRHEE